VLKAAGFNAIRSSHQPMSRAMLDACDRHGLLVMDEAFDVWHEAKREHDYALHFSTWWERDLDAMVAKDFNHPSVIMYSIGNEIREVGTPEGAVQSRAMAKRIRRQDPTRPVTNGVNLLLTILSEVVETGRQLNEALGGAGEGQILRSERVTQRTAESFAALDVAGYNYADVRYESDRELFPNRVIVGSETFPRLIDRNWRLVLDNDHVIGDFTWTGWDYLGEAGVGRVEHDGDLAVASAGGFAAGYPWRTASCGDIDIVGERLPVSYYREIVFGLRSDPYLAVRPPAHRGARRRFSTPWSWSSAVAGWTWEGDEGRKTTIEVYADADEVELFQDGRSLGRKPAGEAARFSARFETTYEPGELTAVSYREGAEIGRTTLRSAVGEVGLAVSVDRSEIVANDHDLAFVNISLVDADGTVHPGRDRQIAVTVHGAGVLQGLGSAAPSSEESFLEGRCTTYRGRALAVVRPTGSGEISVKVTADGCDPVRVLCAAS
jgi:beta-galactosidase